MAERSRPSHGLYVVVCLARWCSLTSLNPRVGTKQHLSIRCSVRDSQAGIAGSTVGSLIPVLSPAKWKGVAHEVVSPAGQ